MFAAILIKYISWLRNLPKSDILLIIKGVVSPQTMLALWEVLCESLLHRRIFRINRRLGYMHMSLAFGWFLLIVVGWAETVAYLGMRWVPLQGHVFFKYFAALNGIDAHIALFDFLMDLLLLFVLSGVAMAWYKRRNSAKLGMKQATTRQGGTHFVVVCIPREIDCRKHHSRYLRWRRIPYRQLRQTTLNGIRFWLFGIDLRTDMVDLLIGLRYILYGDAILEIYAYLH